MNNLEKNNLEKNMKIIKIPNINMRITKIIDNWVDIYKEIWINFN